MRRSRLDDEQTTKIFKTINYIKEYSHQSTMRMQNAMNVSFHNTYTRASATMMSLRFCLLAFVASMPAQLGSMAAAYSTCGGGSTSRSSGTATGLASVTAPASVVAESGSRRSFFGGALSTAFGASIAVTAVFNPSAALAAAGDEAFQKKQLMPLETYLYTISRVREATAQEMRLIKTGKFKDAARGNVKLAVRFMLNNYRLSDNVIAAASYLKGQQQIQAGADGQKAVQALYTILEYFDAGSVENIKVDNLAGKEQIVLNGLEAAQKSIDQFLSYFPKDTLDQVNRKIEEENALNASEFDSSLGAIINPNPVSKAP